MENTSLQRVDNILTDVSIYIDRLSLHIEILDSFRKWRSRLARQMWLMSITLGGLGAAWGWAFTEYEPMIKYGIVGLSIFIAVLLGVNLSHFFAHQKFKWFKGHLDEVFEQYSAEHRVRNERYQHLKAQWHLMSQYTARALRDLGVSRVPKLKKKEIKVIHQWRELRLPQLRSIVHQRENEILNQSINDVMSFTEEEVDALLDESEPDLADER